MKIHLWGKIIPSKLGIEVNFLNVKKGVCKKFTSAIPLNGERPNAFPLKLETRQGYPLLFVLLSIVLKILTVQYSYKKKKKKDMQVGKKENHPCL